MDTQGPGAVDPADQWVLDPATGEYRLRTDRPPVAAEGPYMPAQPSADAAADPYAHEDPSGYGTRADDTGSSDGYGTHSARDAYGGQGSYSGYEAPGAYGDHGAYPAPGTHDADAAGGPGGYEGYDAYNGYGDGGYGGGYDDRGAQAQNPGDPGPGGQEVPAPRAAAPQGGRAASRASRRKPRGRTAVNRKAVVWSAGALGVVLVVTGVGVALSQGGSGGVSVHAVDVGNVTSPTVSMTGAMNVLVISAAGQGGSGTSGTAQGASGADSAILLHLSADRADGTAISIPGDLVTAIPDCPVKQANGTTKVVPGSPVKGASPTFAQSLGAQGRDPGCTIRTVNQLTGLKIDHFVLADARAVQEMTTAAGGVEVCLKSPLSDPATHLDLPAGKHKLTAAQAPAFLTARNAPPGHGDVDRARLQQAFAGALMRQWKAGRDTAGALGDAAARTLTVDPALAASGALRLLAGEVGKPDITHDTFAALPVTAAPGDGSGQGSGGSSGSSGGTATLDKAAAAQLFSLVARDIPLSGESAAPDPKLVGPQATPHNTRVTVLNGTGNFGASQDMLTWLQNEKGVNRSANGGDAPAAQDQTRLDYAPNQADQARSLAAMMGLPASALHMGTKNAEALAYMTLTLGKDYKAPGTPIAQPSAPPKGLETMTADSPTCVG